MCRANLITLFPAPANRPRFLTVLDTSFLEPQAKTNFSLDSTIFSFLVLGFFVVAPFCLLVCFVYFCHDSSHSNKNVINTYNTWDVETEGTEFQDQSPYYTGSSKTTIDRSKRNKRKKTNLSIVKTEQHMVYPHI